MRLLIDTQVLLWWMSMPAALNAAAIATLGDPNNAIYLSAASVWEVVIKHASGKLRLPSPPDEYVPTRLARENITSLAIETAHVLRLAHLPPHHRDPFDRIIIAQAQVEGLPIMTSDRLFDRYPVTILPARC